MLTIGLTQEIFVFLSVYSNYVNIHYIVMSDEIVASSVMCHIG